MTFALYCRLPLFIEDCLVGFISIEEVDCCSFLSHATVLQYATCS
jgi:hypothetical protein